jgi:hypothetical protein
MRVLRASVKAGYKYLQSFIAFRLSTHTHRFHPIPIPIPIRYHKLMPHFLPGQTLLIDADDTLWENNIYFERAIAAFIGYLNHHKYTPAEVRKALNAVERETILAHGYGLSSFTRSLVTCFERLSPAPLTEEKTGSWRESGEVCVLRGFPESDEFGSRGRHPLRLQQQVVEVAVAASAFEQRSDIAVDCLHHSQPHLGPAVVQDSLQVA